MKSVLSVDVAKGKSMIMLSENMKNVMNEFMFYLMKRKDMVRI